MSQRKTMENSADVNAFLDAVENPRRRSDARQLLALMRKVTGAPPKMWGPSIVGFGKYHYRYASGRESESLRVGFSPRKQNLVIYIMPGFSDYSEILEQLGKFRTGRSCLYVNKLDDVDLVLLEQLVRESFREMKRRYG
ncbi:MAG: DUF1801 domain-containing protein [Rhodospirillaceae bacterium]|nr:DUF1801 domain-containing protein [Rhodospirillaceae bacterium]MDD9996945.1 DUF1801 domain-containing protein [Rhodospirillaceae bacterium]MDE0360717.1 DUF1801 domain-containing protein [Rhodospirillaceae bacterium]